MAGMGRGKQVTRGEEIPQPGDDIYNADVVDNANK